MPLATINFFKGRCSDGPCDGQTAERPDSSFAVYATSDRYQFVLTGHYLWTGDHWQWAKEPEAA